MPIPKTRTQPPYKGLNNSSTSEDLALRSILSLPTDQYTPLESTRSATDLPPHLTHTRFSERSKFPFFTSNSYPDQLVWRFLNHISHSRQLLGSWNIPKFLYLPLKRQSQQDGSLWEILPLDEGLLAPKIQLGGRFWGLFWWSVLLLFRRIHIT